MLGLIVGGVTGGVVGALVLRDERWKAHPNEERLGRQRKTAGWRAVSHRIAGAALVSAPAAFRLSSDGDPFEVTTGRRDLPNGPKRR